MNEVRAILATQARRRARARGRVWARRIVLLGGAAVALALFLERAGYLPVPWVGGRGGEDRILAWIVVSLAGLVQGTVLLAALLLVA
ncbi:MAG TPA: hypothetical protein VFY93_03270, partial [Planctomycetota bacterium]|nr:hypothetical protein [Planctomycetota bacterium]